MELFNELIKQGLLKHGMRVLDVGVYDGTFAERFINHGCMVDAIDKHNRLINPSKINFHAQS